MFALRREAGKSDGLVAEQEASAVFLSHVVVEDLRQCVTEMQEPVRTGGKTEDGTLTLRCGHGFFCHGFSRTATGEKRCASSETRTMFSKGCMRWPPSIRGWRRS